MKDIDKVVDLIKYKAERSNVLKRLESIQLFE